ncbi:MAG: NAD(P)/FAD-dependent oxidoreductase [Halobacteriaceae archaeon]
MQDSTVAVAGGGLAGLTAARRLADAGANVTVFERRETVGGRVRTDRVDGFTLDRGFQVLFTAYPAARRELDLDALELRRYAPGATICRPNHRAVLADPLGDPRAAVETLLNRDATLRDKVRILRLRRALAGRSPADIFDGPDQSIRAFLDDWGFSERIVENFFAPFYGGITLDRSLGTSAAVFEFTFAMLAAGDAAVPVDGMGAIPEQMAETARDAGATVETNAAVTALDGTTLTVDGETVDADAVVVATDPPTARDLTGVEAIPTDGRGCVTQYYRFPGSFSLDAGKRLLLNAGENGPNHVAPHSAVAPGHAPDDATLVSATYLGDAPDADELRARSVEALRSWFPERQVPDPEVVRTDRIPFAQFAQPPGFYRDGPAARTPEGAVYLAGDYTHDSSINGAIESGRAAAAALRGDR